MIDEAIKKATGEEEILDPDPEVGDMGEVITKQWQRLWNHL